MEHLPLFIGILFGLTTYLCVALFYKASHYSTLLLCIILIWLLVQTVLSTHGFYKLTQQVPPRFVLLLVPPLLVTGCLFLFPKGRLFIDSLNIRTLTILHVIRIPVEVCLYLLCMHRVIPQLMTFGGRNFDILSGISAPLVYYFGFIKKRMSKKALLAWNIICLGLVLHIVVNVVLSAPLPFQQFGFEQPNLALLYFPFVWLPCCVVPVVIFSHLASIRQLLPVCVQEKTA